MILRMESSCLSMMKFKIDFSVSFQLFNPFKFFWLIIIESAQSESHSYKSMLKKNMYVQ